ncbi:FkbM family methyltransferase [Rhizobium sp. G21]|nr:FkbM family methyltransferase [Rhizobium sp. G21]
MDMTGSARMRHGARAFSTLPGVVRSVGLLEEIANGSPYVAPIRDDLRIGLYGAGDFGRMALDVLTALWIKPAFLIDRNPDAARRNPVFDGIPIYAPEETPDALKDQAQILVTVATAAYAPIESALYDHGFQHVAPFYDYSERYRHIHPLSNGWRFEGLAAHDQAMIVHVLQGLEDDVSRAHHLQFLAWRRLRQEWTFDGAPIDPSNRYFIPEVETLLGTGEHFVDAGAYRGHVSVDFARRRPDWDSIAAIEPDPLNRAEMERGFAAAFQDLNKQPMRLDCALGAANGEAAFHHGLGYASQLSATGGLLARLRALDDLDLAPSFLKLHLEGGELDALKGASQTLAKHRPIIAATIYHNDDGVWRTPLYLMQTLKNYRFLLRLHAWCGTGAVLYALPRERSEA